MVADDRGMTSPAVQTRLRGAEVVKLHVQIIFVYSLTSLRLNVKYDDTGG